MASPAAAAPRHRPASGMRWAWPERRTALGSFRRKTPAACALSMPMAASIWWRERMCAATRATAGQPLGQASSLRTMSSSTSSTISTSMTCDPSSFARSTPGASSPPWRAPASPDPWTSAASIRRAPALLAAQPAHPGAVHLRDGGPAQEAGFYFPYGIGLCYDGYLHIADTFDHRVRRVTCGGCQKG
jgi:hypothetical protein